MTREEFVSTLILLGWRRVDFYVDSYVKDGNVVNTYKNVNQYSILRINKRVYKTSSYKEAFDYILKEIPNE